MLFCNYKYALLFYNIAFTRTDFGLASAWGVSMLVALSVFSILYVIFTKDDLSKGQIG